MHRKGAKRTSSGSIGGTAETAPHRPTHDETLARALAFIAGNEGRPVHLAQLCSAAGVSERTLRSLFLDAFGVPPHRYLRARRLLMMRAALVAANPHVTTVGAIAARYGFQDGGRMATEYRAMFGEYPSATLSRRISLRP